MFRMCARFEVKRCIYFKAGASCIDQLQIITNNWSLITFIMKKIILLSFLLSTLISSCKKDNSDKVKLVDPVLNCIINDSTALFQVQIYEAGPNVHIDTKYLPGVIIISNIIHFESQPNLHINIQKRFQITSLENSTSLIETQSHGDTIPAVQGLNTIYNLSDNEFKFIFKTGDLSIVKNAGSYASYDEDGVVISYSTNKGTYFSTDLLLPDINNPSPYFKIEKVEYLTDFNYKNPNEAIDPRSDKAYFVTAKFSMKFIDKVHSDTIFIKDAKAEFVVYNSHYVK